MFWKWCILVKIKRFIDVMLWSTRHWFTSIDHWLGIWKGKSLCVFNHYVDCTLNKLCYQTQVDIRDIATGESLFKLSLNQMVITVTQADYRGRGVSDLVICTRNGDIKGYERSKINLQSIKQMDHSELNALMTTRKNLMLELSQYQSNAKINKEHSEWVVFAL